MAAKTQLTTMAVVDGRWMLPVDDAITLVHMLTKAVPVTREYSSGIGYIHKISKQSVEYSVSPLTVAQIAAMNLED